MKLGSTALSIALTVAIAGPAVAQRKQPPKDSAKSTPVPADARPPKGMCRIWLDNVPAAQQPAATDCASAVKKRPANGRVIFGDEIADSNKRDTSKAVKLPPDVKGFTGVKPPVLLPKRPPDD